jgi:hypothetical protein
MGSIRNALILPGELPGYAEEHDARQHAAQEHDNLLYNRARQQAADQRAQTEFDQGQQDRDQQKKQEALKNAYLAVRGIKSPEEFEAAKTQLRQVIPDIDGETFDKIQRLQQIGRSMFEQPETYQGVSLGSGGYGRFSNRTGEFTTLREPTVRKPAPPGMQWNADGSGVEPIPGYVEGVGQVSTARRRATVENPMPSRARSGGGGGKAAAPAAPAFAPPWERKW